MALSAKKTRLWDYGWIFHDTVELCPASTEIELIEQYCSSQSFHLSFLPSEKDETGLHGPFLAERISYQDYHPLSAPDILGYVEGIEFANDPSDDREAHELILGEMRETLKTAKNCFALRFTEENSDQFHGWGSVFFVFREILVPHIGTHSLERFVIGYD